MRPRKTSLLALGLCALGILGLSSRCPAIDIHVDNVVGGVWYASAQGQTEQRVKNNSDFAPGYFRTDSDGSMYASPGAGSTFYISHDCAITVRSNSMVTAYGAALQQVAVIDVGEGKITAGGKAPKVLYDILTQGGRVDLAQSVCVLCMHDDGAHVYVASGHVQLFPKSGIYHTRGLTMMARPSVAVMSKRGELRIEPLYQAPVATSNCLLSGATPEIAGHVEHGFANVLNLQPNPPVSDTE